jgi:hypothetical protein
MSPERLSLPFPGKYNMTTSAKQKAPLKPLTSVMEHALGNATLERLTKFMAFLQQCPRTGQSWLNHFEAFKKSGKIPSSCDHRAEAFAGKPQQKSRAKKKK